VGDADGVVVVPREIQDKALARAFEKVSGEDRTRADLVAGARLREVFEKYRIL
jgi:regulator of RNase E activity RraA